MNVVITDDYKLNLCVIGVSSSIHVQRRSLCYAKRGHKVTVISPVRYEIAGLNNICLPCKFGINKLPIILYVLKLAQVISSIKPDIVHIQYAGVYELLAVYLSGRPYAVTMMGSDILKNLDGIMGNFLKHVMIFCLKRASLLNSVSDNITNVVRKYIGTENRIIKVAWGIDLNVFKPLDKRACRNHFKIGMDCFVVLSPRLLKPIYNIDIIVRAIASLPRKIDSILLLCGYSADIEYRDYIQQIIEEEGMGDRVYILGSIDNESMPYLYNAADISVMVPDTDGMPISLLEGMACGVPNIVTNNSNYDEIVTHNVSAVYVNRDEREIAAAVMRLHDDNTLRSKIVLSALERVKKHSDFNSDVTAIENEYYQIVRNSQ